MQGGQRDLRGADEEQVILGQPVDLLLGVGQHAGPVERRLADQHRRDHRLEALDEELLHRVAHERELEHHERAPQVGKARPRQSGAALHVDHLAGQLEMVAAAGRALADLAEHLVGVRRRGGGQVGQRGQGAIALGPQTGLLVAERAAAAGPRGHLGALLLARRALQAAAGLVLLGPQRLGLGGERAPLLVEGEHGVDPLGRPGATAGERRAHPLGVAPDEPDVEHC